MINKLNSKINNVDAKTLVHIIEIDSLSSNMSNLIDKHLVKICEGNSDSDLKDVKKELYDFLIKKPEKTIMGSIAEFFIHLYLNNNNYKQECLYQNLEENSVKKGFDGYYSINNESWLVESKSGSIKTKSISHTSKIKEAYNDLKNKVEGVAVNNPWKNAYNHAQLRSVDSSGDILKSIKKLSDEYRNSTYHSIKEFNIIPSATIFLDGTWILMSCDDIQCSIESLIQGFEYNKIKVICITKKSITLFLEYLKGDKL